jgi:hypothetical protein
MPPPPPHPRDNPPPPRNNDPPAPPRGSNWVPRLARPVSAGALLGRPLAIRQSRAVSSNAPMLI